MTNRIEPPALIEAMQRLDIYPVQHMWVTFASVCVHKKEKELRSRYCACGLAIMYMDWRRTHLQPYEKEFSLRQAANEAQHYAVDGTKLGLSFDYIWGFQAGWDFGFLSGHMPHPQERLLGLNDGRECWLKAWEAATT